VRRRQRRPHVPGASLKIGHLINLCIKVKLGQALRDGDRAGCNSMKRLAYLMKHEWGPLITESAHCLIQSRQAKLILPSTDHMTAFADGLTQKLDRAVADFQTAKTQESYRTLQEVTLVKMIVFNRKRGQDCATATLADYRCSDVNV
jgi:hypothetical protein